MEGIYLKKKKKKKEEILKLVVLSVVFFMAGMSEDNTGREEKETDTWL